jgi:VIT1/CCC1 family predicted Fe2+/Mn2+ transporter
MRAAPPSPVPQGSRRQRSRAQVVRDPKVDACVTAARSLGAAHPKRSRSSTLRTMTLRTRLHTERHLSERGAWLRAAVLGSDDAIVSTASLMIGVASSSASAHATLLSGVAGLVAGAMSMAVGEYVSVSSQRDSEQADIEREKLELAAEPGAEQRELAAIYEQRGLDPQLAAQVADQLSKHDRLGAHLRDELGIERHELAHPLQAAWISALSFATFALLPIVASLLASDGARVAAIAGASLAGLASLGALGAHLGGAPLVRASLRVTVGGALAMAITALVGKLFGVIAG